MEITVRMPVEVVAVSVAVAVRYDEEDIPNDFPLRNGEMWQGTIDLATGQIREWPKGKTGEMHMKVCDQGTYRLLDSDGRIVFSREGDYVPGFFPGSHYGDYIIFSIGEDGRIKDWSRKAKDSEVAEWVHGFDED